MKLRGFMRVYRHINDYKKSDKSLALSVGNFDGFHLGHKAVVDCVKEQAKKLGALSAVMIFEPQPLEYFGKKIPRLFSLREKIIFFKRAKIDIVFCIKFKEDFKELSAYEFVHDILFKKLNAKSITVGSLFAFGKGAQANFQTLEALSNEFGIKANAIDGVFDKDGQRISSTSIRAYLKESNFTKAKACLGRDYSIIGRVIHGHMLGRKIGFPTANINLHRIVAPLNGVFAVIVSTKYGTFKGVANIGQRPTINTQSQAILEVNLFDFKHDLYFEQIEVAFVAKIRDEIKFASIEKLTEQINKDCISAKNIFKNLN